MKLVHTIQELQLALDACRRALEEPTQLYHYRRSRRMWHEGEHLLPVIRE